MRSAWIFMLATYIALPGVIVGAAEYPEHGYPWENNSLGISNTVPSPWTDIQLRDGAIQVWGREFKQGSGVLPEQVTSQGEELFAAPPQLTVVLNGEELPLAQGGETVWLEQTPVRHVREDRFERPPCTVTLTSVYEYDGLLQVKLRISSGGQPYTLGQVDLALHFRQDVARNFSRFLAYDYDRMTLDREDLMQSFGTIGSGKAMGFHPALWVGNGRVGLEWVCETNANWEPVDSSSAIEMLPDGDEVVATFRTVASSVLRTGDFTYTFGLYPTPVKPLFPEWREVALSNVRGAGLAVTDSVNNCRLGWGLEFPFAYPGLPVMEQSQSEEAISIAKSLLEDEMGSDHSDWLEVARQKALEQGLKFVPYGALYQMPARLPRGEWEHYDQEWKTQNPRGDYSNPAWARLLDLEPGSVSAHVVCMYPESMRDFLVWTHVETLKQDATDGLYLDVSSPNRLCQNSAHDHPAGDVDGVQYYPLFWQRKLMQRLYVACKDIDPDFLIFMHHAKCPMISCGFADVVLSGEPFDLFFRQDGFDSETAREDPSVYIPDYSIFPDEMYRILYSQGNGVVNMLLPQIDKWIWPALQEDPDLLREYSRILYARAVLYDIPLFNGGIDYEQYNDILRARRDFGDYANANRIGPLESPRYVRGSNPGLDAAIYHSDKRPNRLMLVLANLGGSPVSDTLVFDPLHMSEIGVLATGEWQVRDAISGQVYEPNANELEVAVPANDYILLDCVSITGMEDQDGDGLPDDWEAAYFGGPTNANPVAMASNKVNTVMEAYIADIDPTDPDDFFEFKGLGNQGSDTILSWPSVSGRVYSVYWTSNLLNDFQIVVSNLSSGVYTDLLHSADSAGFYRIDVGLDAD